MTTLNGSPLSWGPIPSGRLKNIRDFDEWSSLGFGLSVRGMLDCTCPVRWVIYSYLSPVVHGNIALSINTIQYFAASKAI